MLGLCNRADGVGVCYSHDYHVHIDMWIHCGLQLLGAGGCMLVPPEVVVCPIDALEMNCRILLFALSGDFLLFGGPSLLHCVNVLPLVPFLHACHDFQ